MGWRRRRSGLTKTLWGLSRGFGRLQFVGVKSDPAQRSEVKEVKIRLERGGGGDATETETKQAKKWKDGKQWRKRKPRSDQFKLDLLGKTC